MLAGERYTQIEVITRRCQNSLHLNNVLLSNATYCGLELFRLKCLAIDLRGRIGDLKKCQFF